MSTTTRPTTQQRVQTPAQHEQQALTRSTEIPDWAQQVVGPYLGKPEQFNLVMPAIPVNTDLGFGYVPTLSVVQIDTDASHQEIYKVGSTKNAGGQWEDRFALGKPALEKIGSAAGIMFNTFRTDDRRNPRRCEFACRAAMKNESGAWVMRTYSKELDLDAFEAARREEKAKQNARSSEKKSDVELEAELRAEMGQIRKHMAARCETGAILRAIRGLLGIRSQWSVSELRKPFVVFRVDFKPDSRDPAVRAALVQQGFAAAPMLYGAPAEERQVEMRSTAIEEVETDPDEDAAMLTTEGTPPAGDQGHENTELFGTQGNGETDYIALVLEGCRSLNFTTQEQADLFRKHGNDYKAAYAELSRIANVRAQR